MFTLLQFFGKIDNPLNPLSGNTNRDLASPGGGLINLLTNLIRLITIFAGLFALFNIILAGFDYISSQGDPKTIEAAKSKIMMSLLGIVIIVASFIITGLVSKLLFGNYTTILNPVLYGPSSQP